MEVWLLLWFQVTFGRIREAGPRVTRGIGADTRQQTREVGRNQCCCP